MQAALIAAAVCAAILAIRAHYLGEGSRWQVYLFKPLATLLILCIVLAAAQSFTRPYPLTLAAGLLLSTAGDVFLMLPKDRFIAGLASFLAGHLCYIAAFSSDVSFGSGFLWWLPFFAAGGTVVAGLWSKLPSALRWPVLAYVLVIATMAGQATGRWISLDDPAALSAAVGAGLFVISDATLAIDRFGRQFHAARALTLATYYAAQLLIALSATS
ncbi:MAG: lysoplasmalogenase [Rhodocyclaceae bacterium]|nr:MAG: lysoplasmalogenase [Rhodocyclaceae bacterium]